MRTLSKDKVPQPHFPYEQFHNWLLEPHEKLAIEIGCGVGLHPIQWAQNNMNSKLLAIERTRDKFDKFSTRIKNHEKLTNIYPAHADAGVLLPHLNIHQLVDEYYILYPNPYPKSKHANLRFAHSPLTTFIISTLKPGGKIHFATNISSYAQELRDELPRKNKMNLISDTQIQTHLKLKSDHLPSTPVQYQARSPTPSSYSYTPKTHFEAKYLRRGEICYHLTFKN